jgi:hypothetical protein
MLAIDTYQESVRHSSVITEENYAHYTLEVRTLDGMLYPIDVHEQTRAFQVRDYVAHILKIECCVDFRIFAEDTKKNLRVLDEQEQISKVIPI